MQSVVQQSMRVLCGTLPHLTQQWPSPAQAGCPAGCPPCWSLPPPADPLTPGLLDTRLAVAADSAAPLRGTPVRGIKPVRDANDCHTQPFRAHTRHLDTSTAQMSKHLSSSNTQHQSATHRTPCHGTGLAFKCYGGTVCGATGRQGQHIDGGLADSKLDGLLALLM